jgi:hypothetical protein
MDYLEGRSNVQPNNTLNSVLQWVRAGTPAERLQAWNIAIDGFQAPAPGNAAPGYGARADVMAKKLLSRLYLDAANLRGRFNADPPRDAQVTPRLMTELKNNLLNVDAIRSFPTRRVCVDILKKLQTTDALMVLREARAFIEASKVNLSGADLAQTEDLVKRIDIALNPYFTN